MNKEVINVFYAFHGKSQKLKVLIGFELVLLSHYSKSKDMNRAKSVYKLLICSANIVVENFRKPLLPIWVGWPCPVRSSLKRTPVQEFDFFF